MYVYMCFDEKIYTFKKILTKEKTAKTVKLNKIK